MKKILVAVLTVVALLGLATGIVWAAPPSQEGFNLVPTEISFDPQVPYPGRPQVEFTIKYENQGTTAVPEGTTVEYRIVAEGIDDPLVEGEVSVTADLAAGNTGEVTGIFQSPREEGDYNLTVFLKANEGENELSASLKVESALPPGVAQLFAGLGMFAAVMAIMAVGTEVVIDSLKFFLGMKQKVTAMEAFDQLKAELPGQLTTLGADAGSLRKVDELLKGLDTTLKPVTSAVGVYEQIKEGHFGEAFKALKAIEQLQPGTEATDKKLDELKEQAKLGIHSGFVVLRTRLPLSKDLTDPVQAFLLSQIDQVTIETAAQLLDTIVKRLQETVLNREPEWTAAWMKSEVDTLITQGKSKVAEHLENDVIGTLRELGFGDEILNATELKLKTALDSVALVTREKTDTYVQAAQSLLMAVEERRNEMQSPARKIYRRLRDRDRLSFWGVLLGVVVMITGIVLAVWPGLFATLLARLGIVAAGLLIGALLGWGGDFLKGTEKLLNAAMGREQDPTKFGKVSSEFIERIEGMVPTTVAKVLLLQEDHHRDEEASRIRILRVITIIVGTVLAYWLKVDAADYLDYAVPGIAGQINSVKLHEIWPLIPAKLTVGIVLTGLAASAGSKFWHDLLGRLQSAKGQAEEAAKLVRRAKGMIGPEGSQ